MKKYTAKQIIDQKISFKPMSKLEFEKLANHFKKLYPGIIDDLGYQANKFYRFYSYGNNCNTSGSSSYSYLNFNDVMKSTKEISFEEFDFEEELPQKWCVKGNEIIRKYFEENNPQNFIYSEQHNYYHSNNLKGDSAWVYSSFKDENHTEITFEQFELYFLKTNNMQYLLEDLKTKKDNKDWVVKIDNILQYALLKNHFPKMASYDSNSNGYIVSLNNSGIWQYKKYEDEYYNKIEFNQIKNFNNMENKKLIGYKLKENLYYEGSESFFLKSVAALGLIHNELSNEKPNKRYILEVIFNNSSVRGHLQKAGVLDLWFEPIYEQELKVGEWVTYSTNLNLVAGNHRSNNMPNTFEVISTEKSVLHDDIWLKDSKNVAILSKYCRKATAEEIASVTVKTVRMGGINGFDLTIKNKEIYHKTDKITNFVKKLVEKSQVINRVDKIESFDFICKDVIISKTGCENKETLLSEWVALYKASKE